MSVIERRNYLICFRYNWSRSPGSSQNGEEEEKLPARGRGRIRSDAQTEAGYFFTVQRPEKDAGRPRLRYRQTIAAFEAPADRQTGRQNDREACRARDSAAARSCR